MNVLPSARVTGSKGEPLAKTHFLDRRKVDRVSDRVRAFKDNGVLLYEERFGEGEILRI